MATRWFEAIRTELLRMQFAPHRRRLYQILGRAAKDGRPMLDVLTNVAKYLPKGHPMSKVLQVVTRRLRAGGSAGKGVATIGTELRGFIPGTERNLICAGESSARAHDGYMGAASVVEWSEQMKKEFRRALATPAILVCAVFGLLYVISEQVMPEFAKMFSTMPPNLQKLNWISENYFVIAGSFFAFTIGMCVLYRYGAKNITGEIRRHLDRTLFKFSTEFACAYFMQNIANFVSSGVSIVDAVNKISESDSRYIKYQCSLILAYIRKGVPFEETLSRISLVPAKYHWVLAAYGMMSDKDKMYSSIAQEIKEDLSTGVNRIASIVNMVVLVLFAGLMGFTYFTLMDSSMSLSKTAF